MEEESTTAYHSPLAVEPPQKGHKVLKVIGILLLVLLLAGTATFSVLSWMKNNDLQSNLTSEQNKNQTLTNQNVQLQKDLAAKPQETTPTVTETLTSGKTASYPLTEGNARVLMWEDAKGTIGISDKQVLSYVSSLSEDMRKTVCNSNNTTYVDQKDISMGVLDVTKKSLQSNQYANCLQSMASSTLNKDTASRTAAQKVLDAVTADLTQFVKDVTVK